MEPEKHNSPEPASAEADRKGRKPFWTRRAVIVCGTLLAGFLLYHGLGYLVDSLTHESTDDAFLDGNILAVASRAAGQVLRVGVTDNQKVKTGDLLVEVDPRDAQVALDQKRAALVAARSNVELLKADHELNRVQVASAQATARQSGAEALAAEAMAEKANTDLRRASELMQNRTISAQEFDSAQAAARAAEANLNAARQKTASDQSKVTEAEAEVEAAAKALERGQALASQAELDVRAAELALSYTQTVAPEAGQVTRKAVVPGDFVQVGQSVMALVPNHFWVTANFKETQLQRVRVGQIARIRIDAVGHRVFAGRVESIQSGSGARFSLLPPENAVGNFVKIVQRVPVKIVFTEPVQVSHVLGPGMSAVPSVRVSAFETPDWVILAIAAVIALGIGATWWRMARRVRGG